MSQNMSIDEIERRMIDAIERLMKDGKIAEADAAAKELSELEPGNARAKMLYGTCRQLLGDEETFKRIHDELAPVMEKKDGLEAEEASLWKKYHALWMSLIVGGLVLATGVMAIAYFAKTVASQVQAASVAACAYRGPERQTLVRQSEKPQVQQSAREAAATNKKFLYAGPRYDELEKSSK